MITNIARLLQARKPNAPVEWMQKLPQMARRLEESLFRSAQSFEEYRDTQTLKKRLQALAMAMGLRAQQQKQQNAEDMRPPVSSSSNAPHTQLSLGASAVEVNQRHRTKARNVRNSTHMSVGNSDATSTAINEQISAVVLPTVETVPHSQGSSANVGLSVAVQSGTLSTQAATTASTKCYSSRSEGTCRMSSGDTPGEVDENGTSASKMTQRHSLSDSNSPNAAVRDASSHRIYHSDQRQQVLRQQQQRLLLLRHASKCPHENGACPVTPHCAGMKRLWKHIAECKDQQCQMAHCVSSRYVLSHYHRCKDPRCAVCGPVREAIQRNHEKAKQLAMVQHLSGSAEASSAREASLSHSSLETSISPNHDVRSAVPPPRMQTQRQIGERLRQRHSASKARSLKRGNTSDTRARSALGTSTELVESSATDASLARQDHHFSVSTHCISEEGTSLLNSFTPSQIHAHLQSLKSGVRLTATKIRQKCAPVLKKVTDHENSWIFMRPVDPIELNLPDYFDVIKNPMDLGAIKKRVENNYYKLISEFAADIRLTFDNAILYNGSESDVAKVAHEMKAVFDKLYNLTIAEIDAEEEMRKSNGDVCVLCGCEKLMFEPTVYYCNGSCNGQRIRRNSYYYTGGRNHYHWCQQCYHDLSEKEPLEFADCTLWKKELQKKKNDEMHEEPWVECSQCKRWVHQICALFNGRMNKGNTIYHCPFCFMARRGARECKHKPLGARNIRHTLLSRFLEDRVLKSLSDAPLPSDSRASNYQDTKAAPICVRQLSNIDKIHPVKPKFLQRYATHRYPYEFPVRSKCILLFQEMDGVDVILFGMYLYEYGDSCPEPNRRRVYVSYLDSVHYFRPRQHRTMVYHEMLIAYLAYVKSHGFHTAHIWACPPCKGDDYIFFCHPEDQKTPKDDRLRSWYVTLLETARAEGIVTRITNLWEEHFAKKHTVLHVPYFEGDYWPGEAENVAKALEDELEDRNEMKPKRTSSSSTSKSKVKSRSARGLRSDAASSGNQDNDVLLMRMGDILEPMKDAFIVAYLQPRVLMSAIQACSGHLQPRSETKAFSVATSTSSTKINTRKTETPINTSGIASIDDSKSSQQIRQVSDNTPSTYSHAQPGQEVSVFLHETSDKDELIESEFFDTRQQFLNLCQGNHYQFDELRRAKHTSMMALYHIHNPEVPKFLMTCSNCANDINTGYCYTSDRDSEFHLCQDCFSKTHKVFTDKTPFRRSVLGGDTQGQLTEEQRRDRQRSIQLHMQLLQHASCCRNQHCPSANCTKMKNLLKHGATCSIRVQGGCAICRRIWALLQIHARQCRRDSCLVPKCRQLKEQLRALAQQQAQMDERRRAAMNANYRRDIAPQIRPK